MLKELYLKNYTLAKELRIEFNTGLNIITGESGAGKSVIIGAIDLLLGARAQTNIVRHGEKKAVIEAVFNISKLPYVRKRLEILEYEESNDLILRREISMSGQNRVFINDSPASKTDLAEITEHLIDLHGQHDHQRLMSPKSHLFFVDSLIENDTVKRQFKDMYSQFQTDFSAYKRLLEEAEKKKERMELLQFQFDEIDSASISEDEEVSLQQEEKQLQSAEEILGAIHKSQEIISGDDISVSGVLTELKFQFEYLERFDTEYTDLLKELKSFQTFLAEASFTLQNTQSNVELNPKRLEAVQNRLFLYESLKRKYGNSTQDVICYYESIQKELEGNSSLDDAISSLQIKIESHLSALDIQAKQLTEARYRAAENAESRILPIFKRLGMEHAELKVAFKPVSSRITFLEQEYAFSDTGAETVEFLVKTNSGGHFLPLAKTASGGELSRIMLAFKSMLAEKDHIPLLVFDEIDTGISGKISEAVGNEIVTLSQIRQILCITHSPQIAAKGRSHFKVQKSVRENSTETEIRLLQTEERITEISQLISAGEITENSKILAKELLIGNH